MSFATVEPPLGETKAPADVTPTSATLNVKITGTGGVRHALQGTDPLVFDQLRAHWRMDEGSGTKITSDLNDYVGNFNGSSPAKWVTGKFGTALEFNTGDNQVVLPNASPAFLRDCTSFLSSFGASNVKRNTLFLEVTAQLDG